MKKAITVILLLSLLLAVFSPLLVSAAQISGDTVLNAVWKQGRLYDQPESEVVDTPKRRYTVISGLEEGDVLKFNFNQSLWGGYAYPADNQGAIGSDVWFDVKNNGTYTVEAINGRVPNKLRICVFDKNYADITDAMWTRFDMKITKLAIKNTNFFKSDLWSLGSYRDGNTPTASSSSKYTVISCREGEFYTFNLSTSDWNVYVTPADSQGAISGAAFTVSSFKEYVVRASNGRIPTQLRVTVTPKSQASITDALWNTFTATCYRKEGVYIDKIQDYNLFRTAEWKKGAYNGTTVVASNATRCTAIPCNFNDTFTFKFNGSTFGIRIDFYDKYGKINDFGTKTVTSDSTLRIEAKGGRLPTKLHVTAYLTSGGNISDSVWNGFNVSCTQDSDFIRVATMNFGLWNDGATKSVADSDVPAVFSQWKAMLSENDVDILAGQEWIEYFDRSGKIQVDKYLFRQFYKNIYSDAPKKFYSKMALTNTSSNAFRSCPSRSFSKAYTMINGKKVCLINAHCSIETTFETSRKQQFLELIEAMNKEEYVILFGDFNAYTVSEFNLFTQAGYTLANCGKFGEFETWPHFDIEHSWKNEAIDNVIVSSNIKLLNVKADRRDLSDHSMLYADIQLIDKNHPEPELNYVPVPETNASTNNSSTNNTPTYQPTTSPEFSDQFFTDETSSDQVLGTSGKCGSSIAFSALTVIGVVGAALLLKKKED